MHIHEATAEAARSGKCIARESVDGYGTSMIKPTNTYDTCLLLYRDGSEDGRFRGGRMWNPTLDDLIADDWTVVDASRDKLGDE